MLKRKSGSLPARRRPTRQNLLAVIILYVHGGSVIADSWLSDSGQERTKGIAANRKGTAVFSSCSAH